MFAFAAGCAWLAATEHDATERDTPNLPTKMIPTKIC